MISWADDAACLAIDRGSCHVSARSVRLMCQYSSTMLCAWLHAHKRLSVWIVLRTPKQETQAPRHQAVVYWGLAALYCPMVRMGGGKHMYGICFYMFLESINIFSSLPPFSQLSSWKLHRQPWLWSFLADHPGAFIDGARNAQGCPVEWRQFFFRAKWMNGMKWNEMEWNEMKWNEMKWKEWMDEGMNDRAHDWRVPAYLREGFGVVEG